MKKKYVLKNKTRFTTVIMIMIITITTTFLATTVYGYKESSYKTIIVRQGDTLWDIANKNNKESDIRKYIYEIKKVNNLNDGNIISGQELKIPVLE
ncbi:MAG: LysM peptidoglycan-binding domain-containing protein [Clostridia bacterium]|nr:LysM peptidoglycan-binding domain-containing protein [Clostridia bacterium]